ncbi:MAG: hypothetical protein A3I73_02200 [Omnitrophica bacterium RIFCSPLOWO2_02_FULL_45_16]|nr:MAG: hypothetical protein A3C51_00025 [Omnitrophica bacterium RIFCSPHIGHO2_02_FULL_46_20]OGW94682.1 MAG: hypothetical protein A3K16_00045 [Omnitrophica bacterium RIFCSPLOWO2_01_FULL_45_24]OGX01340.1 MAG: hypothetical protein A3I73_02200 [Omnitrophica bacterium RIFCSPLOWO2_02_FULL_45_16]
MTDGKEYDFSEPIEISNGIYWVGFHEEGVGFQCNPYLMLDGEEAVIFDPGNTLDYPKVASKVFSIIDPDQISHIILHHQDPDFCSSAPLFESVISNPGLRIVTHSFSSLFSRYYGFSHGFYLVDRHKYELTLKSGRKLRFIHTPFCHSPGAIVTYDEKNKLLFSSDIFGSVSSSWNFFAGDDYQEDMKAFHLGYMASNRHVRMVMEQLEKLEIDFILPQHGSIIKKEQIQKNIDYLKGLQCGIDASNKEDAYKWVK